MGVVFQDPGLDPRLSCAQNLRLAARLHGICGKESEKRVAHYLEMAALSDRASDPVKQLSGGMKRRLDLARALIHEPRILLMDEPTSGLDESAFRQTWDRLETMRTGRELSILVTTHRPEEGERCDRVAILAHGKTIALDSPQALRQQVAHDVVVLRGDDLDSLRQLVLEKFGADCIVDGDALFIECEKGHELIPRVVEALPNGRLRSVSLRHPSLADVFLKITGYGLESSLGDSP
jgi:ABC-2 type transport system ATP-binding protein